jgi:uncharacterized repeat protein (TIGR01451 family)
MKPVKFHRIFYILMALCLTLPQSISFGAPQAQSQNVSSILQQNGATDPPLTIYPQKDNGEANGGLPDDPSGRADSFYSKRTAGDPSVNFTLADAAKLRSQAADQVLQDKTQNQPNNAIPYDGNWSAFGPNPIVQVGQTSDSPFLAMSGRIGALAIASTPPYTMYLGAAQGGVWISSTLTSHWTPVTDQTPSLAIGAIALAPSNENIVYVGTGEGALSSDSYFGNGVLKSVDGGRTFNHVSGTYFQQVSISKIAVDPNNPDHLYVATLSGRGGSKRVPPPFPTPYGIWESNDGGVTWTARLTTNDGSQGATDLVIDPQNSQVLYASFWGQGIVKTTDGGATWNPVMNGLPNNADYTLAPTRFALGISHPSPSGHATLYTGFEWYDTDGNYHSSTVWKSTDDGASWSETNTAVVEGYCGTPSISQCFYDNMIGVDPSNTDIVFALGLFNYGTGTGGVFRSMDGGATWVDLGWHQHPDFHAIAFRSDDPSHVMIGNDGGVWYSTNYGGRTNPSDPASAVDWHNLNGYVDPTSVFVQGRSGLQITQFTSAVNNPTDPNQAYGGAQDNGTFHKFDFDSQTWYDLASGDGGNALVDPENPSYVYGTYYGISPYRFDEGMSHFFANSYIVNGLNLTDRSDFYIPFVMNKDNPNQLFLGTYRLYRTDNARASSAGDVQWIPISGDLTSGCTGPAPNGARNCTLSAIGVGGGKAVYTGSLDGLVYFSTDAQVNSHPSWTRLDYGKLPNRPVSQIAVDSSNYRLAYIAYSGFNAATPLIPGHVFKTTNAGQTWTNVSGDLPDVPVNTLLMSPTDPNILYAGTDVGPMVTTDGGAHWNPMGTGFPIVAVTSLDLNPYTAQMLASTHGRGAWVVTDTQKTPALQIHMSDAGVPVGPGSLLTYLITVKNLGNADATGVVISDTLPNNTSFVSASAGGLQSGGSVVWNVGTVMSGTVNANGGLDAGSQTVTMTVRINLGVANGSTITNQEFSTKSSEGPGATGSPYPIVLAPPYALSVSPASQIDGNKPGGVVTYTESVKNLGFSPDAYTAATSGNQWPTTLWDSSFTTQITKTGSVAAGDTAEIGVKVSVPMTATSGMSDTVTVNVASMGNPAKTASASIETIAVTKPILLVDNDDNNPDVQSYYRAALDANGYQYDVWDLAADPNLPPNYLNAHQAVVWFTGASYPGPIQPYESELATFLNNGGKLFMSGMDILDQAAGTTAFVKNYLHINWDSTDAQNDIGTTTVTAVPTNTVMTGLGTYAMDYASVGLVDFSDEITLIAPAIPAFLDDSSMPDALTVSADSYKVMFLAFPFEAMGTAQDKADVLMNAMDYFGISPTRYIYMPLLANNGTIP